MGKFLESGRFFLTFLDHFSTNWETQSLAERKKFLQTYNFVCYCKACVNDFRKPTKSAGIETKFIRLEYFDSDRIKVAKNILKETFKFIDVNIKHITSTEVSTAFRVQIFMIEEMTNLSFFPRVNPEAYFQTKLQLLFEEQTEDEQKRLSTQ